MDIVYDNKLVICGNCMEKTTSLNYYESTKKTWCNVCQEEMQEWITRCEEQHEHNTQKALNDKGSNHKKKVEKCENCMKKSTTVKYYENIKKTWCLDCIEEWQEWMISSEENERNEQAVRDIKLNVRFGERLR